MKYGVSVMDTSLVGEIEESGRLVLGRLEQFAEQLRSVTTFQEPRGIVFHDYDSATTLFSTIPLPAYTSRDLIHMTPTIETWKQIYLTSAKGTQKVTHYYNHLELDDVVEIAAHELTHHADFFHSEFEDWEEEEAENMWFEEGMCFYIPRKFLFTQEKFDDVMEVERELIHLHKGEYGEYTLDQFGKSGYRGGQDESYAAAFYDYWRSTATVHELIHNYCEGDLTVLIGVYRQWVEQGMNESLQGFFIDYFQLSEETARKLWLSGAER
ncbi:hypothetical protein N781_15970 [Pontibacillus halophilus JSM 076056 = DSM 19796]|uniref:Uncharacterized protein n=1 Tax=Pontibacillus halophilus JSM 076056 = DSM 19796 TaxID=1385510 RepID=A0A0A5GCH4_9BACI|nr:hypothetical protein [Pontibacillus halophilus]KGX89724.1 hypothetical protein N781_15970 [Pontibacillus halophilus JSM 076056 = DSM 19796]